MSTLFVATIAVIVAGASLWGWGWAIRRCARTAPLTHALTIAVGLAVVLFLGGVLNLLQSAYSAALDAMVVIGLALMVIGWLTSGRLTPARPTRAALLAAIPVLAAGWFLAACLLPQSGFNAHDDLEKYFTHPFIMLAMGTLPANPLGSMGAESLGGQALLQAFVVAHFPVSYISAADTYFCLLLCVALAGFALKPGNWALGALAAELGVLAINPQLVNISAIYSAAALLMAAVFLIAVPATSGGKEPSALVLGLIYAGVIALKSTYVPFIGLHFLAVVTLGVWLGHLRLRWAWSVVLWTLLFVAPWVALYTPLYLTSPAITAPVPPGAARPPLELFSPESYGYGATQLHYTGLALACLLLAAFILNATRRGWLRPSLPVMAAAAAGLAAGLNYLVLIGGGQVLFDTGSATRYATPVLMAVLAALLRLVEPLGAESTRLRFLPAGAAAIGLAVAVAFLPSAMDRIALIKRQAMPLAFFARNTAQDQEYILAYNHEVLSGSVKSKLASLQALVPAGEPLGVWVMAPFWLDFKRNPVWPADPAGLSMRWTHLPPDVKYFLWEYEGYAVRPESGHLLELSSSSLAERVLAARSLTFIAELKRRAGQATIVHRDESYILMRFEPR